MAFMRRTIRLIYRHRYLTYSLMVIATTIIYLLYKWNFFCFNAEAQRHVDIVCDLFRNGLAVGSLCSPLCVTKDIKSLQCHSFQGNKDAVFSATWHGTKLVFKSAAPKMHSIHWYDNGVLKYPTESEFLNTVKAIAKKRLNLSLPQNLLKRLGQLRPNRKEESVEERQKEMNNLWVLLQDNEYLLSVIYVDKDVFPQLLGTCGTYFAVEYMEPVEEISSVLALDNSASNWGKRLKTALVILELLEDMDIQFKEPLYLCDIKIQHFGYLKNSNRMRYIDLNHVYPKSVLINLMKNVECTNDEDCEILDCRGYCNKETNHCSAFIANNNLQVVCEKIFLGWRLSNTLLVPGLLMAEKTPSELASILRQCANPLGHYGKARGYPDEEMKKRLYNTIIEMEQMANSE